MLMLWWGMLMLCWGISGQKWEGGHRYSGYVDDNGEKCKNFCGPNRPWLKSSEGSALPIFLASREQGAPLTVSPL